jgi:putative endonuclease
MAGAGETRAGGGAGERPKACGGAGERPKAGAWVYILRCGDGSLYTGWSTDVARRLARHRSGRASRYTASRLPVELVLSLAMADRGAAMREEARIKRLDRAAKLALIGARGRVRA